MDEADLPIRTTRRSSLHRRGSACETFVNCILTEGPTGVIRDVPLKSNPARTISVIDEESPGVAGLNSVDEQNSVQETKPSTTLQVLVKVANSLYFTGLVGFCTIYSLFASDLRTAFTDVSADPIFGGVATVVMTIFIIELALNCRISGKTFITSFQFWLDLVSIIAMVADVPWIFDPMLGDNLDSGSVDSLTVARASRVSKLAARAARIGRIFRIVRLLRLTAVTQFAFATNHQPAEPTGESADAIEEVIRSRRHSSGSSGKLATPNTNVSKDSPATLSLASEMSEGSAIGRKMSELTTMRVIMIVLLIISIVPYLDLELADQPVSVALQRIEAESDYVSGQIYINSLISSDQVSLLYLKIGNVVYINRPLQNYRSSEVDYTQETISEAIQDIRYRVIAQSYANLELMAFTVFILGTGALLFSRDTFVLVIAPIERMVQFVRKLATNPLDVVDMSASPDENQLRLETELLESTLVKLGSLLQIGFGTAGASIIAKNFKDHGRVLNPMLPGSRVNAVFAFCDIRRFTDTTECLKESVMVFVNEVANIVHGCCHRLGGAANKNIGDAFFIVWKLSDNEEDIHHPKSDGAKFIADQSIIAFVHCIVELLTSPQMQRWREDKRITDRMPGYNINLGVGIHWGWAIEGAIGTEQKIDASYLSPHVEMSQTLEEMTKVYGVPILFSGDVYDILSPQLQSMCRLLDAVEQRDSKTPLRIYTFDIGREALEIQKKEPSMPSSLNRASISLKEAPSSIIKRISIITGPTISESSTDPEIIGGSEKSDDYVLIDFASQVKPYRVGIDNRWVDMYNQAVQKYLSGNWPEAKTQLDACSTMVPNDHPTKFLLRYLETHGPLAPTSWPGYRIHNATH